MSFRITIVQNVPLASNCSPKSGNLPLDNNDDMGTFKMSNTDISCRMSIAEGMPLCSELSELDNDGKEVLCKTSEVDLQERMQLHWDHRGMTNKEFQDNGATVIDGIYSTQNQNLSSVILNKYPKRENIFLLHRCSAHRKWMQKDRDVGLQYLHDKASPILGHSWLLPY